MNSYTPYSADGNTILEQIQNERRKYKSLKKECIPTIPNDELENAMMNWMWGKIGEDWPDQYQIISVLPKPCQNVYSCRVVTDEVNNGGLNQLFFNPTGQFAKMSIEGFWALGSSKLSNIMEEAVALYQKSKEILDGYDDGTLEGFFASYEEGIFDKLDESFFRESGFVDYVKYIRLNSTCFGD